VCVKTTAPRVVHQSNRTFPIEGSRSGFFPKSSPASLRFSVVFRAVPFQEIPTGSFSRFTPPLRRGMFFSPVEPSPDLLRDERRSSWQGSCGIPPVPYLRDRPLILPSAVGAWFSSTQESLVPPGRNGAAGHPSFGAETCPVENRVTGVSLFACAPASPLKH